MIVIRIYDLITQINIIFMCFLLWRSVLSKGDDDLFCNCQKKEIKCKGIQDFEILQSHFAIAKVNCSATKLRIVNSQLPALPHELFSGSNFTEIRIDNSAIPYLVVPIGEENPFIGNSVVKFALDWVRYPYNWNWYLLNVCENMTELRIVNSDMVYLGPTFSQLILLDLESLVIKFSKVRWIHDKAFSNLKGLASLNLMNNNVRSFKRSILPDPALNLAEINLRNNALDFLEEDIFENMPILTFVNLENNHLVTLSEFKNKGFFFLLSGNPLQCDCSIEWLQRIKNATDSYRLHCFTSDDSILVKKVDWDELDC